MKFIPTSLADLEKLKGRAKTLKRRHNLKHRDALERAAKEAGYLHWHHAIKCQEQSDADARRLSMSFLCECMRKDAIKGETHYIAESQPFPYVLLANGQKDGLLLDLLGQKVLVLAERGEERQFTVDEQGRDIRWHGEWSADDHHKITVREPGHTWEVPIDGDAYDDALERVADQQEGGEIHFHDVDDPASDELLDIVISGQGLETITDQIAEELVASGYERNVVHEAMAAGAMYSRKRGTIFYPPEGA